MAIPRYRYAQKKKRKGGKFQQGVYQPIMENNSFKKYTPPIDRTMNKGELPEYRSSWELKFMKFCDSNPSIKSWGTEVIAIPYQSPKDLQIHRYYVDFFILLENGEKHLIEIKPFKQCQMPVNLAKFEAARYYCKQINAKFSVITEKELKKFGVL